MTDDKIGSYLVLDKNGCPLARASCLTPPDAPQYHVKVEEERADEVAEKQILQLVSMKDSSATLLGRVVGRRDNLFYLEPLRGEELGVRENLRIPVRFNTFLYPVTGAWKGRRTVISNDLSCGGIAFFCAQELQNGEVAEIVIPLTSQPLLVRCRVLRRRPTAQLIPLYAAEFVGLIDEQAAMLRETVYGIQIETRDEARRKSRKETEEHGQG